MEELADLSPGCAVTTSVPRNENFGKLVAGYLFPEVRMHARQLIDPRYVHHIETGGWCVATCVVPCGLLAPRDTSLATT